LAVDSAGSARIAGSFTGDIGIADTTLHSTGAEDCFVARLDPAGQVMWAVSAGGGGVDSCQALALDENGNSYVVGFSGSTQPRFGTLVTTPGIFVAKLDETGLPRWLLGGWNGSFYFPLLGASDPAGSYAVVAGTFFKQATVGTQTVQSTGGNDLFVASLAGDKLKWVASAGGQGNDRPDAVSVDASGNIYVTGSFGAAGAGAATFGPITVSSVAKSSDVFVAKYAPDGTVLWVVTGGGDGVDGGQCIAVDGNGDVLVAGSFGSKVALFGGHPVSARGQDDVFVWKFVPPSD
jgi:hypothetical protein